MMLKNCLFALAIAAATATSAQAATVTAVSTAIPALISGFTVTYTDTNGNNLMDLSEVTAFSGMSFANTLYTDLVGVGFVAGISASSDVGQPGFPNFVFSQGSANTNLLLPDSFWSFSVAPDLPTVPLPAGMPLLLAGIGAIAVLRRRGARG